MPVDTPERCKSLHGNDFASEPARDFRSRGASDTYLYTSRSTAAHGRGADARQTSEILRDVIESILDVHEELDADRRK